MRSRIFLILFSFPAFMMSQDYYDTGLKADSTLAELYLTDGSVINGMITSRSPKEWIVYDYSLGKVILQPLAIKSWKPIEQGAIITITLSNKSIITGKLSFTTSTSVIIKTESLGEQEIFLDKIISLTPKSVLQRDPRQNTDSNRIREITGTRYFFSRNAIPMKRKKLSYRNTMLYLSRLDYAFFDNLSVAIGSGGYIPWVGLKTSVQLGPNWYAGLDLAIVPLVILPELNGGYIHGMFTYGDYNNNISFGAAEYFLLNEFSQLPVLTLSGSIKLGTDFWLVTDNLFLPLKSSYYGAPDEYTYEEIIVSLGFRFSLKKNTAWEAYFIAIPTENLGSYGFLPIPFIAYTHSW